MDENKQERKKAREREERREGASENKGGFNKFEHVMNGFLDLVKGLRNLWSRYSNRIAK